MERPAARSASRWSPVLGLLALCLAAGPGRGGEETIVFPADAGVIDVTRPPYNAAGDGTTDDTGAIQRALYDYPAKNRIIYLPHGTYLVSDTLRWGPREVRGGGQGDAWKLTILQGQSRDGTVIQLRDRCPGYQRPAPSGRSRGKPVVWTGGDVAQRFRNAVRDLTIDTGRGNPAAVGLQFTASNQGVVHRVRIRSADGQGLRGLDLGYANDSGPGRVRHLEVEGFDIGVYSASLNPYPFEHVVLRGQRVCGFRSAANVSVVRRLVSDNRVPAVHNGPKSWHMLVLLEATLAGGDPARPAVLNEGEGRMFLREVRSEGYGLTVGGTHEVAGRVEELTAHGPVSLFPSARRSLGLPVEEPPRIPWGDIEKEWASPMDFGAVGDGKADDTQAVQRAIDSGATTVYLPGGKRFYAPGTLRLRGKVRRLIGCESTLWDATVRFVDGEAPAVVVERLQCGWRPHVTVLVHESARTLVVRDVTSMIIEGRGTGRLFADDVVGGLHLFEPRQKAWVRYLNFEQSQDRRLVVNRGATLWMLGFKTENPGPKIVTTAGGRTEVLGGFLYANFGRPTDQPAIRIVDSRASFAGLMQTSFNPAWYEKFIQETRGGDTRTFTRSQSRSLELFVAYAP
ncbi:MAG: glycosyl hydrolase family 28-related protein [bacterium]